MFGKMHKGMVRERERERDNQPGGPAMHWNVPGFPESSDILCIPPVSIELPISKAQQLGIEVHHRVEDPVEAQQPEQMVRQLQGVHKQRHGNVHEHEHCIHTMYYQEDLTKRRIKKFGGTIATLLVDIIISSRSGLLNLHI